MDTKRTCAFVIVGLVILAGVANCPAAEPNNVAGALEQRLGKAPSSALGITRSSTANGCRIAWAEQRGAKCVVVIDGQAGLEYDGIMKGSLVFSSDGKRVAYVATKGDKWLVVVDGQAGPEYDGVAAPIFSPNGKRVAYTAGKNNKGFVVVDGQVGLEYDAIGKESLIFSSDGKQVAYRAKKGNKWLVVIDNQVGPEYDTIGTFVTTFGVSDLTKSFLDSPGFVLSSDGKRVAYNAKEGDKWFMVVDGKAEMEEVRDIIFSPDGKRVAYVIAKDNHEFVVIDDQVEPTYDSVTSPIFSPDGKKIAYRAQKGDKWFVVVDGQPGPEYETVGALTTTFASPGSGAPLITIHIGSPGFVFSQEGNRLAYAARVAYGDKNGYPYKWLVIVDGQAGPEYDAIETPVFSPDGKHVAYWAKKGDKSFIVVDGQVGAEYDYVGDIVFSSDGKRMAYEVEKGDKRFVIVDGKAKPEYDGIACEPIFLKDGTVEYIAGKKDMLYRVQVKP